MARRIKNILPMFSRSFAKKIENMQKIVIVEKRKTNDDNEVEAEYRKMGGSSNIKFKSYTDMKSLNTMQPYEHKIRMDEKYLSGVNRNQTYTSPFSGYAMNIETPRAQTVRQPTSKIRDKYFEAIHQKKNSTTPTNRSGNADEELKKALLPYTTNYPKNEVNTVSVKSTDSINKTISSNRSRRVRKSSEVSRLDDVHNEKSVLQKEYGKGLLNLVESSNQKIANTKSYAHNLNLKSPSNVSLKTEMKDSVTRKGDRHTSSTTPTDDNKSTTEAPEKNIKKRKLDVVSAATSNSSNVDKLK